MLVATKSDTGDNDTLRHHKRTRKHHALKSQYHTISFYVFLIVSLVVYIIYIGDFISLSIGAVLIFSNFRQLQTTAQSFHWECIVTNILNILA